MFIPKIMWDKLIQKECKDWDREGQEACLNKSKGKKRKKKGGEYHKNAEKWWKEFEGMRYLFQNIHKITRQLITF
jgi:hypothetical protein